MTSPTQAIFMHIHNTLKRRTQRGRGLTLEEMQQAAGEVLEGHTTSLSDQLLIDIADSRKTIDEWTPGQNCAALVSKLSQMASKSEEQGRVFGNRLLTEVGVRLSQFMAHLSNAASASAPSRKAMIAIKLHLDAMIVALDGRGKRDAIDEAGKILLSNLELTHQTIK
jgi:hypothetical protein